MMSRILAILVLVLWSFHAQASDDVAFIPSTAGQAIGSCVFLGATNGSCLAAVGGIQVGYMGPDSGGHNWGFNGTGSNCDSNTPFNCTEIVCNNPVTSCSAAIFGSGTKLVWQNGPYLQTNFPTCGLLWRSAPDNTWATAAGSPIGTGYFLNNSTGTSYKSLAQLIGSVTGSGQILTASPPPWGTCWADPVGITVPNFTLNLGTTKFADLSSLSGILHFVGFVDGGNSHDVTVNGGEIVGSIKVSPGAYNMTFNDMRVHNCQITNVSCFLVSGQNQTTTFNRVLVYAGGFNSGAGQDHNFYIGGDANSLNDACFVVNDTYSLNAVFIGWEWKDRQCIGTSTPGHITRSYIATTKNWAFPHAPMNPTCGGNKLFDFDVIEESNFGQQRNFMILYGDDYAAGGGFNGANPNCSNVTPNHTIVLDHDIFIQDGTFGILSIVNNAITGPSSCTITNSVIVDNIPGGAPHMVAGSGAGGCSFGAGNRFYDCRAASQCSNSAEAGEGWSGTFTDPEDGAIYPCCVWPWLPPHL